MRCISPLHNALQESSLSKSQIGKVLLVGGSSRLPAVQSLLTSFFGKPPCATVNPDEIVALGAAI